MSSQEADRALTAAELQSYCAHYAAAATGRDDLLSYSVEPSRSAGRVDVVKADLVLGAAAEELVRLFARGGSRERLVANHTWQAWASETSRRRARGRLGPGGVGTTARAEAEDSGEGGSRVGAEGGLGVEEEEEEGEM